MHSDDGWAGLVRVSGERRGAGGATAAAVGAQVRQRRLQRGMSAAELARRAGLSKATLSGLEAGTGNPTIETLDAIALALHIPLTDLLARDTDAGPVHVLATEPERDGPTRELLRRVGGGHTLELWRLRVPPHTSLDGLPHAPGTVEHLVVGSGALTAGPGDDLRELRHGDLLAFAGDRPHLYRTGEEAADITVVIASPVVG
ncbi:transcriptional regulator [Sphaerisporangium melleum]|uniref:Transcriptional regulator n=1 Tax=Sphaerisporangium melleum TaxID=321316 RepID=A0A917RG28_9ACTN|nr:XRE family transcriptional regulator [Sphaerisporangium melleum]GGL05604.1 transcriptional regulator [Sphaerisporangium melleum]GII73184.1 transcriptional regulator [Sphaerisporangium melleum]